jgi:spore germination cell wall hydrolase CwlJ-like protein
VGVVQAAAPDLQLRLAAAEAEGEELRLQVAAAATLRNEAEQLTAHAAG